MIQLKHYANKRKPLLLLGFVFVLANFLSLLIPLVPVAEAAAITEAEKQQCYTRFNNQEIILTELSIADQTLFNTVCFGKAYCTFAGDGAVIGSRKVTCPNPSAPSPGTSQAAADAEVAPLVKLACGTAPAGEAAQAIFVACGQKVRAIYTSCSQTGGGTTGSGTDTPENTARCATPRINAVPEANNVSVAAVTTAIKQGRGDADAIITADANEKAKKACEEQGGTYADGKCTPGTGSADDPVCSAGALGWILCPVAELMQNSTSLIAEQLQKYLTFTPLLGSPSGNAIQQVWQSLLIISNVVLVIAVIVIIYSQATSAGLSNYGVKKMLPRLIVVAILMNLSFFICALAIDASNIAGASVKGIVDAGFAALPPPPAGYQVGASNAQTGVAITVGAISLVAVSAAGLLPLLLPILASAVVTLFTALAIVVFRQVALVILIILSPLAFAAYLLPNTESMFNKWRKGFVALLVIYPIIMAVFYGSALVSRLILSTTPTTGTGTGAGAGPMTQIIALAVLVIPLFSLPFLMKAAGGILDRFGAIVNNRSKGIVDRAGNKGKELSSRTNYQRGRAIRKQAKLEYGNSRFARRLQMGTGDNDSALSRIRGGYTRGLARGLPGVRAAIAGRIPNETVAGLAAGSANAQVGAISRAAVGQVAKALSEGVKAAMDQLKSEGVGSDRGSLRGIIRDTRDSVRAEAATELLLQTADTEGYGDILRNREVMSRHGRAVIDAGMRNYGMIDAKSPDIADYITRADAIAVAEAGQAGAIGQPEVGIDGQRRVIGLAGGKMIKFEPRAMARVFRRAATATAQEQATLQAQAQLALAHQDFGDAKPPTQEAIRALAAGNFNTPPPTVIPQGPNGPLPMNEW